MCLSKMFCHELTFVNNLLLLKKKALNKNGAGEDRVKILKGTN